MNLSDIIKSVQTALNAKGAGLTVDGAFGPKTQAALHIYELAITATVKASKPLLTQPKGQSPVFSIVKGVKFKTGKYKTSSGHFEGLVVHYTVSGNSPESARGVVKYLADKGLGAMVMDRTGTIHIPEDFDILTDSVAHAGKSAWNERQGLNSYYAGMEICCMGKGSRVGPLRESKGEENIMAGVYQQYTEEQEQALTRFILWAAQSVPGFKIANVCGHDEARAEVGLKGDKSDPGASLSMTMPAYRRYLKSL